jgi:hypothetical protein
LTCRCLTYYKKGIQLFLRISPPAIVNRPIGTDGDDRAFLFIHLAEEEPDQKCGDDTCHPNPDKGPDEVGIVERWRDDERERAGKGVHEEHNCEDQSFHPLGSTSVSTVQWECGHCWAHIGIALNLHFIRRDIDEQFANSRERIQRELGPDTQWGDRRSNLTCCGMMSTGRGFVDAPLQDRTDNHRCSGKKETGHD